ncbi:MAG: sugar ABC transporter permease [Lachnospiraceae bacterium]|nr:sugar ABC transporter permease [Lachnospiraceae bacterium]
METKVKAQKNSEKKKTILTEIWRARYLYLLLLPFLVWLIVFHYIPMGGIVMAFKDYKARLGILGSPWVGLKHFERIFVTPDAITSIKNTLQISLGRIIWEFPMPILLAIMITEMPGTKVKKVYQTVFTFPHFLSWVVVSSIMTSLFSNSGVVNTALAGMGMEKVQFLGESGFFRVMLYVTENWKEVGWGAIIYMAAIAGIDPTLYEAASIDGASRLRQIWHITLSSLKPTIAIMFILKIGGIMNAGFDQIFNMRNDVVKASSQILDTYIYDITFLATPNYGFSTAVGLFKAVINFILLTIANQTVGILTGTKMFSFRKEKVKQEKPAKAKAK